MKRNVILGFMIALAGAVSLSWFSIDFGTSWFIPEKYKSMENPVAVDDESIDTPE